MIPMITIAALAACASTSDAHARTDGKRPIVKEIKTYQSFSQPIDPARLYTLPDMDISYALAGTLVEWSDEKNLISGLASNWEVVAPQTVRFTLRQGLRWSSGEPLTAHEVKASFERSLSRYPDDLRSLAQLLDKIEVTSDQVLDFKLKVPAASSNLAGKLVEPNYGVIRTAPDGVINVSISSGPFYLESQTDQELVLKKNPNWHGANSRMADRIVIRKPPAAIELATVLLTDSWPNMVETSSLVKSDITAKYQEQRFNIWKRPHDKVVLVELGKRLRNAEGYSLLRSLGRRLDMSAVTAGFSGFEPTRQLFPSGYPLHDAEMKCADESAPVPTLPKRKLQIIYSPGGTTSMIKDNLTRTLTALTGEAPVFTAVPLQQLLEAKTKDDFDLFVGLCGLADPDPEGILSFFFEGGHPVIPSGLGKSAFLTRLDGARKDANPGSRLSEMRSIVKDAVCEGHLLPLFHLSTVGIARPELDLSHVPNSDESVTFSKIRFR